MDNPNPYNFHWPKANTLLSNCTQLFPLDKMLTFCFQYRGEINLNNIDTATEFFKYNKSFQNKITQFLIEIIEKVCSVAFNLLANKKCNQNQAKCFAAKNMLQNIKYLCLEVSRIIKDSQQRNFKQKEKRIEKIEKLTRDITSFICQQIKVYIQQIFPKYPSTPLSGYSQKLQNAIRLIDRRQDYTYDFLHIHKLQIGDAKNTQELISQIMEFLNKVKSAPYEKIEREKDGNEEEDGQQETYEECFQKFNKNLVWIISQNSITQKIILGTSKLSAKAKEKEKDSKKSSATKLLKEIWARLSNKSTQELQNSCLFQFLVSPSQNKLLKIMKSFKEYQRYTQDWELIQKYQQELKQYQKEHKFAANAKISMNTQQFQKNQINNAELRFKNSALLRVVVKWVEDLQETLKESQKYVRDNGFKFKIKIQGKQEIKQKQIGYNEDLITLDQQKRRILQSAMKKAESQNKNNKQSSNKINMFLVDSLLEQEEQMPHYNFQSSLKLSSQVNSYIGKETVQKLIKLIGIFGSIPQHLEQQVDKYLKDKNKNNSSHLKYDMQQKKPKLLQQLKKVNFVSNRIGDLLRSKIVCTEPQFIKLLTLLYELDKYCQNVKQSEKNKENSLFFKIIRIKNKLKDTTNNVHINYMLYGKIQCQLQICFLDNKKGQKANQTMHHFLYELKRGIYGVVPQLANIVNQNDPICQHNQSSNLSFIKFSQKAFKHKWFQERAISQSQKNKYILRCIYKDCNQFSLQSSKKFITKDEKLYKNQCLKCYVQKDKSQQHLFDALKKLQYSAQDKWVKDVLDKQTELQIQEITKNEQGIPGVYLLIQPTQKRIAVKLYIIFKHGKTGKLIMKCLQQNSQKDQSNQKALEFHTQKIYQEHKSMKKLYFKVNRFKLRRLLQKNNIGNSNKKDRVSFYIKNLSKKQMESIKLKAVKQFDRALLDKQIQNKQQHLRLGQMQSITNELQEYFQEKQSLMFVQRVYTQSVYLKKLLPISKFPNLKELHLQRNKLRESLTIETHISLTYIDLSHNEITQIKLNNLKILKEINLSHNQITKIELKDLKEIKDINLSHNNMRKIELKELQALINLNLDWNQDLNQFDFIGLTSLQNLSMGYCNLYGQISFIEQLSSLQILKVQSNKITKLDLRNCPSLKNLNCIQPYPPMQLIFNKKASLISIEANTVKRLPSCGLDQLQKIDVRFSADQINELCFSYLRSDNYIFKQSIFDHIKSNKTQLQKLKYIKIKLDQSKQQPSQQQLSQQQSTKLKQWQRNAVGQLLQQLIANLSNLTSLHLTDNQSTILIQHLDLSRVQPQIQDLYIQSKTLKSLKLNKVRKIAIDLWNLDKLQILTPQSLKQVTVHRINKYIYSQLAETSFFQKCAKLQSIRIVGNKQPQEVYEFTNLKHLKQICIDQFSASNMIFCDNAQQQPFGQTLGGNKPQKLTLSYGNCVNGCTIQLSQLTELKIQDCYINNLKIKFPLKSIKKIQIFKSQIQNLLIQYYDENEKADLQYFQDNTNSLALLTMLNTKVNSIKHLELSDSDWKGKKKLRISSICQKIEQLTVCGVWNKLFIDASIKVINIGGTIDHYGDYVDMIDEFEFDNIVSGSNKRQNLTLSLSRQCLLKAKFINNTNQVIDVTIKTKNFKSLQTLKDKNKEQKIRFTFIIEQYKQLKIKKIYYSYQKVIRLLYFLSQDIQIQRHELNTLTNNLQFQCQFQELFKRYKIQQQKLQQQFQLIFTSKNHGFQQIIQKYYQLLEQDQLNQFQQDEKMNQIIAIQLQRKKQQLLFKFYELKKYFKNIPVSQRNEQLKDLDALIQCQQNILPANKAIPVQFQRQ